jgi:hypothetical protein
VLAHWNHADTPLPEVLLAAEADLVVGRLQQVEAYELAGGCASSAAELATVAAERILDVCAAENLETAPAFGHSGRRSVIL